MRVSQVACSTGSDRAGRETQTVASCPNTSASRASPKIRAEGYLAVPLRNSSYRLRNCSLTCRAPRPLVSVTADGRLTGRNVPPIVQTTHGRCDRYWPKPWLISISCYGNPRKYPAFWGSSKFSKDGLMKIDSPSTPLKHPPSSPPARR